MGAPDRGTRRIPTPTPTVDADSPLHAMTGRADKNTPGRWDRLRERRRERRQLRAWRRERRKGFANAYDAVNQAESSNHRSGFFKKD